MTSLYKRATPSQSRVLRIVEGAVKNAMHAHPQHQIPNNMARSIAKRAAGTLTAGWPDVLAARKSRRSVRMGDQVSNHHPHGAQATKRHGRGAPHLLRRSPLQAIWALLSHEIGVSKYTGKSGRMAVLICAIRIIAAVTAADENPDDQRKEHT